MNLFAAWRMEAYDTRLLVREIGMGNLTSGFVQVASKPGRYGDGKGLSLLVGRSGSKSWILRVHDKGKRRDIGLGSAANVSLVQARDRAAYVRALVKVGMAPTDWRHSPSWIPTFRECVAQILADRDTGKPKSGDPKWLDILQSYAFPMIGDMAVSSIDEAAVSDMLANIGPEQPYLAERLRRQIDCVVKWATCNGYRQVALAIRMFDHPSSPQRPLRHRSTVLAYAEVPAFMADLRKKETVVRLALEAVILTARKVCDVRAMEWAHLDLHEGLWRLPLDDDGSHEGQVNPIPLSYAMIDVLKRAQKYKRGDSDLVFRGLRRGKQLSGNALWKAAHDMGYAIVVEGLRTAFAKWALENTSFGRDLIESTVARGKAPPSPSDNHADRRRLLDAWASYCLHLDRLAFEKKAISPVS